MIVIQNSVYNKFLFSSFQQPILQLYNSKTNLITQPGSMQKPHAIYIGQSPLKKPCAPHLYAQCCQLYQIFSQISRIVARKTNMPINQALNEYLNQCNKGQHVVLKSYSSFSKSIVNRQCFLYNFGKIFEMDLNTRNGLDYYQLFRLLCSDFPKEVIYNAAKIIEGNHQKTMQTLIPSQKFLNALYLTFIYHQYLQSLLQHPFSSSPAQKIPLLSLYTHIATEHQKNPYTLQKPPLQILYQIILNLLSSRGLVRGKGIVFVNEEELSDFIEGCVAGKDGNEVGVGFEEFLGLLVEDRGFKKFVAKVLGAFDNSGNWANQAAKLLNVRDADHPTPLNSKKMKKK